jgi:hypothetical protein
MRKHVALLCVAAVVIVAAPKANAQGIVQTGPVMTEPAVRATFPTSYVAPYSYWAVAPLPARGYVGYGAYDAPYYGRPYGSPSDRWSWPSMSSSYYGGVLARYYYPPVR